MRLILLPVEIEALFCDLVAEADKAAAAEGSDWSFYESGFANGIRTAAMLLDLDVEQPPRRRGLRLRRRP